MDDPFHVFQEIRSAYLRYLDSPFRLRYDDLLNERRELLDRDRQLYRLPLIEALPPYESSNLTVQQACATLGVPPEAADFITRGLFRSDVPLHGHQFQAWERSRAGRPVIVTSGTGSGKTEAYLLPIFSSLVEECLRATPHEPAILVEVKAPGKDLPEVPRASRTAAGGACAVVVSTERPNRRSG